MLQTADWIHVTVPSAKCALIVNTADVWLSFCLPAASCRLSLCFWFFFGAVNKFQISDWSVFTQCQRICERWHSLERWEWIHEPCKKTPKNQKTKLVAAACRSDMQNKRFHWTRTKIKSLEFLKKEKKIEANSFTSGKNKHENKKNNSVYIGSYFFYTFLINPHFNAIAIETVSTRKVEYNLIYWPSSYSHRQRLFFSLTLLI